MIRLTVAETALGVTSRDRTTYSAMVTRMAQIDRIRDYVVGADHEWERLSLEETTDTTVAFIGQAARRLLIAVDWADLDYVNTAASFDLNAQDQFTGYKCELVAYTADFVVTTTFSAGGQQPGITPPHVLPRGTIRALHLLDVTQQSRQLSSPATDLRVLATYEGDVRLTLGRAPSDPSGLVDFYPQLVADLARR